MDKYRKALCCKCSNASIFLVPKRHYRVESIYLLKSQCCKLAKMFCCGKQCFRIILKLLSLLSAAPITIVITANIILWSRVVRSSRNSFHFFLLLLHIIRNSCREVVIGILPTLPVCDIGFRTKQTVLLLRLLLHQLEQEQYQWTSSDFCSYP